MATALSAASAACQFPQPADVPETDAAIDARDDVVFGRRVTTWVTLLGESTIPHDLSNVQVRVLVTDSSTPSGFRIVTGAGHADGTFTIEGVPPGDGFVLALDQRYWATDARSLELHDRFTARAAPSRAITPTPVRIALEDLSPFAAGLAHERDSLIISSAIAGAAVAFTATPGATQSDALLDWSVAAGLPAPLIDSTLGDDVVLLQHRIRPSQTIRGASERVAVAGTAVPSVVLRDGTGATIAASLTALPPSRLLSRMSLAGYDALYDRDSYAVASGDAVAAPSLLALPFTGSDPVAVAAGGSLLQPTLASVEYSKARTATGMAEVDFADALPINWPRLAVRHYTRVRRVLMPGAQAGAQVPGGIMEIRIWSPGVPSPAAPDLTPPRDVRIDDVDAAAGGLLRADAGAPLRLSWGAVARASQYQVTVFRARNDGLRTFVDPVATMTTADTNATIPAEALGAGEFFAFSVAAIDSQNRYADGDLLVRGLPLSYAAVPSGLFRLSATCGNGRLDPGEDCDGVGPLCDPDCSFAACGDGFLNPAAGETCDSGGAFGESPGCDRDCTLAVCGDSSVNRAIEQCDDGNAVNDNNGCSETCLFDGVCGDGIPQLGEDCDPGSETVACDDDCTTRTCGDGYANVPAGEQCDDGGLVDGDGCSSTCRLEAQTRARPPGRALGPAASAAHRAIRSRRGR